MNVIAVIQGIMFTGIMLVVEGATVSNMDVIAVARLAVASSSAEGEEISNGLITQFSARWSCSCSGFNLCSLRDLITRGKGGVVLVRKTKWLI